MGGEGTFRKEKKDLPLLKKTWAKRRGKEGRDGKAPFDDRGQEGPKIFHRKTPPSSENPLVKVNEEDVVALPPLEKGEKRILVLTQKEPKSGPRKGRPRENHSWRGQPEGILLGYKWGRKAVPQIPKEKRTRSNSKKKTP